MIERSKSYILQRHFVFLHFPWPHLCIVAWSAVHDASRIILPDDPMLHVRYVA
jgi:hypothetical protein